MAAGVAWAVLGTGGRPGYTEPSGNPSLSAPMLTAIAPDRRQPPRDMAFADAQGRPLRLGDFAGRTVLVNLWATWCPPCVAEMPDLDALEARLGGPGFQVVAISLDRGGAAAVDRWFARSGLAHLAIHTANPADFPDASLPTSILLDKQGRVAWTGLGAFGWTGAAAMGLIRTVMAEPAAP